MNSDTTGTDTTDTDTDTDTTDTTGTGAPVTIAELAEFLRHLARFRSPAVGGNPADHAALLARKADLFARIAAAHPGLIPPSPTDSDPT